MDLRFVMQKEDSNHTFKINFNIRVMMTQFRLFLSRTKDVMIQL